MGNLVVNTGTAQAILVDTAGTVDIGLVKIDTSAAGTFGSLWSGAVSVGTLPNLPGGTVTLSNPTGTTVTVDHGTVTLSNPTGTTVTVDHGTITLSNPTGTTVQFNNGTIDLIKAGTITTLPNIPGGTITNLASGTINSATAVINSATISVLPNLPQGSIQVTAGTITGGTITSLVSGTINSATAVVNSATISVLPNLPQGSINITAGTIATLGTMGTLGLVNTVTTVSSLTNGSIVQTAGTINIGTIVGKDANAAAQTGNPIGIGGTDSGGTIRTIKVDSGGLQRIGLDSGTVSVLPNIPGGTITNLASGTINSATAVINSATISVLPNLPQGSINVTAGTFVMTSGTLNVGTAVMPSGTLNVGTINTGTINLGTVVGKDANAAVQSGNPITIAGTNSGGSVVTFVTAQSAIDTSAPGLLGAGLLCWDGAFWRAITAYAPGDGNSNDSALETMARNQMWNGASWDRMRGNQDGTFLASGTYNTTQTQADQTNYNFRGIRMTMDITGTAATGTLTPEIDGKDVASGKYYAILTGGAVPAQVVSTNTYEIYPAIGTSVSKASDILPRTFRIKVSETGSGTITYSVGYSLIV